MVQASPALARFIGGLEDLAKAHFPVDPVTQFLQDHPLQVDDLAPYTHYRTDRYARHLIYKTGAFELLLLCWKPGQKSAIHGHEGEKCWMRVELGTLRFANYIKSSTDRSVELSSLIIGNIGFVDGPASIHAVENVGDGDACSLHLYAKPFAQCDVYADQEVKRVSLSYDSMHGIRS